MRFLDTSVLVAAVWGDHQGHEASLRIFAPATKATVACGTHSLAEAYAVLTALPVRPPLLPDQVMLLIDSMAQRLTPMVLDTAEYLHALREASDRGIAGGRIYDALLLECARKARAETIYTWNLKHFRAIAPDLSGRMRTP